MARKGDLRIDTDVVSTKALNMYSLSYRFESLLKSDLSAFEEDFLCIQIDRQWSAMNQSRAV